MFKLQVYSHGFKVTMGRNNEVNAFMQYVSRELLQQERNYNKQSGHHELINKAIFAASTSDHAEYRLMYSDLKPFLEHLKSLGFTSKDIMINDVTSDSYEPISLKMQEKFKPRDQQQQEAVDFFLQPDKKTRVAEAATGFGKTFCGFWTACNLGRRTAFIMEPGHLKTWTREAQEYTDIDKKDMVVIQGGDSLRALFEMMEMGIMNYKFIFISATTFRNYIKAYENKEEPFPYSINPDEFFPRLKIGFVIRDEAHEAIHALCKQTMYMNVPTMLALSATLVSDDNFVNKMYDKVFPKEDRWKSRPNEHIVVRSLIYEIVKSANIRAVGPKGYSHITYEKNILRKKRLAKQYSSFLMSLIEQTYIKTYKPKLKCLVICGTIKMCEFLASQARIKFPDKTVGCYAGGAKPAELYERDIVFSTPKGAGTGVDLPGLSVAFNTVALGSTQLHRQIMGRLRPIKFYPEMDPVFFMLFNRSIPQHRAYEKKKQIDCMGRSKHYAKMDTYVCLGT